MARDTYGRWLPGHASNPGGKVGRMPGKGLAAWIREQTHDGYELAEWCLRVMRGHEKNATPGMKQFAVEWLANRGFGKAPEVSLVGNLDGAAGLLSGLDTEELKALVRVPAAPTNALDPATREAPGRALAAPPDDAELVPLAPPPPPPVVVYKPDKCATCGMVRSHYLDCPERPKPAP